VNALARPLDDVRVVSLAINLPGPAAAARLHALGAHITKVEPPDGDPLKTYVPAFYEKLVEGQNRIALNLKDPGDRAKFDDLLRTADLFLTSNRLRALAKFGLDWDTLHAVFPRLCHVAIVGYAAPHQDKAGHDLTYQAHAGLLTPPEMPRALLADLHGAEMACSAAAALLFARERTGTGGYAEVALSDAAELMARPLHFGMTRPGAGLGGGLASYRTYKTANGHIALAALEPHFWLGLGRALGRGELSEALLERVFLERTAVEWERWADEHGLPIAALKED
jgi:alpha-methylacyl-CoA racemase